jgi:dihydrofolate reductase
VIHFVVATDSYGLIGKDNDLPWGKLPVDLKHFQKITTGHTVVMGRKTFESIGKPLKNRKNIVLSRTTFAHEGVEWYSSIDEVLELPEDVFIIGGSQIYKAFLPYVDKIYHTGIIGNFEGDTYFPDWELKDFEYTFKEITQKDEKNKYQCVFSELTRRKNNEY